MLVESTSITIKLNIIKWLIVVFSSFTFGNPLFLLFTFVVVCMFSSLCHLSASFLFEIVH